MQSFFRLAAILFVVVIPTAIYGQDKFFDSNGVRIRYIEQGAGEAVVLIHGYSSSAEMWLGMGVFQNLSKNYHVIALDCRGHGKSDKPHDVKRYGQEMALDIVRLLDHLNIDKAHIVGYSMGGNITLQLLTMKPERFLCAILGGAGGRFALTDEEIRQVEQMAAEMERGSMRTLILSLWPKDQAKPTEEELNKRETDALAGKDLIALAAVRRSNVDQVVTEAQVAAITVPTMAFVGTADPNIDKVNRLKKSMPQLRVVTIEGVSHANERPGVGLPDFTQPLREFLEAHSVKK